MTPYYDREEWPGFLASIRANPDDDLPRLVAADFLEENGESERAEFVRVGVQLGQDDAEDTRNNRYGSNPLRSRAADLLAVHGHKWGAVSGLVLTTVPDVVRFPEESVAYVARGFVSRVRAPLSALIGGEACGRCGGTGSFEKHGHDYRHSACHGTGRTPGVLRELLRREPLVAEGIEVSDWGPAQNPDGSYSWWRLRQPGMVDREYLLKHPRCGPFLAAPTESAARLALSRAVYAVCSG